MATGGVDWPSVGLTVAEGLLVLLLTYLLARLALAPQYVAPVLGAVGLFGLAFGLAFQDVLKNWISGFFLLLERPFNLGDWIIVGTWSGRVETIRLRVTEMRAVDGEKIMVPNQQVYTSAIINRSSYASRRFVSVARIPEGADPRGLLTRALAEVTKVRGIASDPTPRVALVPKPDGPPTLEASFWINYREFDIDRVKGEVDARIAHVALGRLLDSGSDLAVARQADLMGRTDDAKLPALKPPRKSSRRSTGRAQEAPTRRPRSGS